MRSTLEEDRDFLDTSKDLHTQRVEMEQILRVEAAYLRDLARALNMVGNFELADNISSSSGVMLNASKASGRIASEDLSARVEESNRSLGETLGACLDASICVVKGECS